MQAMKRSIMIDIVAVLAIALLVVVTFSWVEARKEVIYLCDNFVPGVPKYSVERQLNTTRFLLWDTVLSASGSRIEAYSPLHMGSLQCSVDFNRQDIVVFSIVE